MRSVRKLTGLSRLVSFLLVAGALVRGQDTNAPSKPTFVEIKSKAEAGDPAAQDRMGDAYFKGEGVATNFSMAVSWYRKAAEQGNPDAESGLGNMYSSGWGVDKDEGEAMKWYGKAAEQGDSLSAIWLGDAHSKGEAVFTNLVEAVKWYEKVAKKERMNSYVKDRLVYCYSALGLFYYTGNGVLEDKAETVKWYRKAAELGDKIAQSALGICYYTGDGVPKDDGEARKWSLKAAEQFRNSAEQGDVDSQLMLAFCYETAREITENVKWLLRAAEQGKVTAQYDLGINYSRGEGVPKNDIEAYKWFSIAAANGLDKSAKRRDSLAQSISREEIVEGQRRATAFVARKESPGSLSGSDGPAQPGFTDNGQKQKASGTAFFVSEDGYLLTAYHIVEDAARIAIKTKQGTFPAKLVKSDKANDVALLKVGGKFPTLPVASSREVRLGEPVFTIGFPNIELQGFSPKLTRGEISSLTGMQDDPREFQISVAVQPGNSGGPLVNEYGNVVGFVEAQLADIPTLKTTGSLPQSVNYAMKSSALNLLLESLPEILAKLTTPNPIKDRKFEDVEKEAESAVALVLVY
jgi:TPR repeat protein